MEKDPFKEYLRESEPDKAHKGYAWSTAIGLQAVDGLKLSKYLPVDERTEEADKVSSRISEMHLSVQIIRTCKKVFTKQQSIWKCFSEICF